MNKSAFAVAALSVATGAVFAQSSITIYGRVDLSVGKAIGSANKYVADGSSSRLGFRGDEDLGNAANLGAQRCRKIGAWDTSSVTVGPGQWRHNAQLWPLKIVIQGRKQPRLALHYMPFRHSLHTRTGAAGDGLVQRTMLLIGALHVAASITVAPWRLGPCTLSSSTEYRIRVIPPFIDEAQETELDSRPRRDEPKWAC